jgi:UrcA family protein
MADEQAATASVTRTENVSLADLDLSTPEGVRAAHDRLHETARRLCSQVADSQDISHQPNYVACVDETLANALRQLNGPELAATEKSPR